MLDLRPHPTLGGATFDWLDTRHHFSFGRYHDPNRPGWGALRVWNDDAIAPHSGFPLHPHRDMEIITFVRDGAISHGDNLGNRGRTVAGDVQVMSAGTGIFHEEMNREDETTRIFQIWIEPARRGGTPSWTAVTFPDTERAGQLVPLASGQAGKTGAAPIRQDATLYGASLDRGERLELPLAANRFGYLVPAAGSVVVNGQVVGAGDGLAIHNEERLELAAIDGASSILFADVPEFPAS
ncbi:MAG: pirin family protein [Pseudomonadota bacterium]